VQKWKKFLRGFMARLSNSRTRGYEIGTGGGEYSCSTYDFLLQLLFFFANANNGNSLKKAFYLKSIFENK
jgi:hypothetical protein